MKVVNQEKNEIFFDQTDLDAAWKNAPILDNKNPDVFRLCYICKFHLERARFFESEQNQNNGFAWTIDLINAKKPVLEKENYIAVHWNCVPNRKSLDSRKQLKKIYTTKWLFDEEFWEKEN